MTLRIIGAGPLMEQARRLADAAGMAVVSSDADYILPATEDDGTLKALAGENVLFDAAAWAIASSRLKSDALLREHGIPAPAYFPGGSEPYIVKPDRGGFGLGIWVTDDYCEVGGAVNAGFVTQEELSVGRRDRHARRLYGAPRRKAHVRRRPSPDGRRV